MHGVQCTVQLFISEKITGYGIDSNDHRDYGENDGQERFGMKPCIQLVPAENSGHEGAIVDHPPS